MRWPPLLAIGDTIESQKRQLSMTLGIINQSPLHTVCSSEIFYKWSIMDLRTTLKILEENFTILCIRFCDQIWVGNPKTMHQVQANNTMSSSIIKIWPCWHFCLKQICLHIVPSDKYPFIMIHASKKSRYGNLPFCHQLLWGLNTKYTHHHQITCLTKTLVSNI